LGEAALLGDAVRGERAAGLRRRLDHRAAGKAALDRLPAATQAALLADDFDRASVRDQVPGWTAFPEALVCELLTDHRYAPYVRRQQAEAARIAASSQPIPAGFAFNSIAGLSSEMVERLSAARPDTIAQASRIRGITPAALTALLVATRRIAA
jgi:tRNA uridine 5-carboxymethylaminomethyl modification enzyme